MAKGIEMLMRSMGINPEELLRSVQDQVAPVMLQVSQGAAAIEQLAARQARIEAKLDRLLELHGFPPPVSPSCPAVTRMQHLDYQHTGETING